MVLLPAPRSPNNKTETGLCPSSRTAASTAFMLGLTASNNCGIPLAGALDNIGSSIDFRSNEWNLLVARGRSARRACLFPWYLARVGPHSTRPRIGAMDARRYCFQLLGN